MIETDSVLGQLDKPLRSKSKTHHGATLLAFLIIKEDKVSRTDMHIQAKSTQCSEANTLK